jgi:chromate transporter
VLAHVATLFVVFARIGLLGFGGGPSFIPLIQREVETRGWLTREGFLDAFAFGNALPGPIATKLAGYVGYRIAGWAGALSALLGLTVPTIIAMIALAALYVRYAEAPLLVSFLQGLRPVVIALLVMTVVTFAPSALGPARAWRDHLGRWALMLVAFVLAVSLDVHPALLIAGGGVLGLTVMRRR